MFDLLIIEYFCFIINIGVDRMYDYIIGKVTMIKNNAIILENNGIGYYIFVSNPYSFEIGVDYKVFVYQQIQEDGHFLYGFKTIEEKDLFLKLISVKGLGCKIRNFLKLEINLLNKLF